MNRLFFRQRLNVDSLSLFLAGGFLMLLFFSCGFWGANMYAQQPVSFQKQSKSSKALSSPSFFFLDRPGTNLQYTNSPGTHCIDHYFCLPWQRSVNAHVNPIAFHLKHLKAPLFKMQTFHIVFQHFSYESIDPKVLLWIS